MDVNEIIIEEVRKNECLYDLSSNLYKNIYKKAEIWEAIAKSVNLSGEACKKRCKGLRDTYKKHKRVSQLASGSGAPSPAKKWRDMQALSFLDNYRDARPTVGNVTLNESELENVLDSSSRSIIETAPALIEDETD
ncbi:uncharacterized protein LOC118745115 [Rhagoletis pomonella]|uniref:uncharacterized protein LOC118745115 n=1 Tax=Rhagoletis pomonella TaxID=28610 RepID=UPI001780F54C|nr:uncharacterized protein LOC118745115 [Rhagoletis pomonella]